MDPKKFLAALAVAGLTACSATSGGPALPGPRTAQSPSTAKARLEIRVPRRAHGRRARYVSAATQSAALAIAPAAGCTACTGAFDSDFALTKNAPDCHATASGYACDVTLALKPGIYSGSLSLYDGPLSGGVPTGTVLSANQNFVFPIVAGVANTPGVTLDGVPASVALHAVGSTIVDGTDRLYKNLLVLLPAPNAGSKVELDALDPDGYTIVGPGAPTFSFNPSGGFGVSPAGGNQYTITAPSAYVKGTYPLGITIQSGACNEPGANCGAIDATTFDLGFRSFAAVIEYAANAVAVTAGGAIATVTNGISAPTSIAFDQHADLFVANYDTNAITEYAPPYTSGPVATITKSVNALGQIATDSGGNLYVMTNSGQTIAIYPASNYLTSSPVVITTGMFATAIGVDSNFNLWVGGNGGAYRYPSPLSSSSTSDQTCTSTTNASSIAFDSQNDVYYTQDTTAISECDRTSAGYGAPSVNASLSGLVQATTFNLGHVAGKDDSRLVATGGTGGSYLASLLLPGMVGLEPVSALKNANGAAFDQYGNAWVTQKSASNVVFFPLYDNITPSTGITIPNPTAIVVYPSGS